MGRGKGGEGREGEEELMLGGKGGKGEDSIWPKSGRHCIEELEGVGGVSLKLVGTLVPRS